MIEHSGYGYSLVELVIVVAILTTIAAIAIPSYMEMVNTAKVVAAMGDIRQIQFEIEGYHSSAGTYPSSLEEASVVNLLDPWGRPYQYLLISGADKKGKGGKSESGKVRKDKNLHPLNSDYDLYSMGRDGLSVPPLTAQVSHDDVIRANNGGFIGLAQNY